MSNFKNGINLWQCAFSTVRWKNKDKIDELLSAVQSSEGIIEKYLEKTESDFPFLTDHSISHSHMLWKYADIIVGDTGMLLNPLEGFILNSVFLLHDAGMCYSILNNKEEIKNDLLYQDYILSNINVRNEEVELEALFYTVRQNHGEYALKIATELLNGEEFFIANADYRQEFGDIIGKIAKSHTCNINYIEREFGQDYASPGFPSSWNIDIKKLAFILRTADAANIDNQRTPKTLKMISEIRGESKEHWTFQKKLGFPILESDGHLVYSTNSSFNKNEQKAWWFCYGALKVLDDELKNANNYFVSVKKVAFAAKSVKYIDDTLALGINSIKTSNWDSINTSVRVSNPIHIAAELGGEKLYGDKNIAIREIIQNSIDSIHVHRLLTGQDNRAVGRITVALEELGGDNFLTISDNGIGMSQSLMTNELLDFGGSYWRSSKFYTDFVGLKAKGFESIGKFGIGFFSVFMITNNVTVTSWKYGENISSMRTLDFYDGLFTNPILRQPTKEEKDRIIDRGTSVRIKLRSNRDNKDWICKHDMYEFSSIKSLVQYYIPSADVEILVKEPDRSDSIVQPCAIEKLHYLELLPFLNDRIFKDRDLRKNVSIDKLKELPLELIEIIQNGKIRGRLSLLPDTERSFVSTGIIVSKGIRVKEFTQMVGFVYSDEVISIKRDIVSNTISYEALKDWAIKQIAYFNSLIVGQQAGEQLESYKKLVDDLKMTFSLYENNFPLMRVKEKGNYRYLSVSEFRDYVRHAQEIKIYQESHREKDRKKTFDGFANIFYGIDFENIIANSDMDLLNNSQKVIFSILDEIWGEYEKEDGGILEQSNSFYLYKWTFTRKLAGAETIL